MIGNCQSWGWYGIESGRPARYQFEYTCKGLLQSNSIISFMEEFSFNTLLQEAFSSFTPSPSLLKRALQLFDEVKGQGKLTELFEECAYHQHIINPYFLFKYLRYFKRLTKSSKEKDVQAAFGKVVVAETRKLLHGKLTSDKKLHILRRLGELLKGVKGFEGNVDVEDGMMMGLLLGREEALPEEVDKQLLEKLKTQVLIDHKQRDHTLSYLTQLLSQFVIDHSEQMFPTMKRLLMRSSTNINLWKQVSALISHRPWEGQLASEALTSLYDFISDDPDTCAGIVNDLTSNINNDESLLSFIQAIDNTIRKTYNEEKKVVYMRMLEGVTRSAGKLQRSCQEMLRVFVEMAPSVNSEEVFEVLSPMVRRLMTNRVRCQPWILAKIQSKVKEATKYGLLILSNILSESLVSQEERQSKHFINILSEFQAIYDKTKGKMGANPETFLASLNFLVSQNVIEVLSELPNDLVFSSYDFTLEQTQLNSHFAMTLLKAASHTTTTINTEPLAISCLTSMAKSDHRLKQLTRGISNKGAIWLITQGVFTTVNYNLTKSLRLIQSQLKKLVCHLVSQLNPSQELPAGQSLMQLFAVLVYFKIPLSLATTKLTAQIEAAKETLQQECRHSLNLLLASEMSQNSVKYKLHLNFLESCLKMGLCGCLKPYADILFDLKCYSDPKCLKQIQSQIETSLESEQNLLVEQRKRLVQGKFPVAESPKKVEEEEELRMLDEKELKEQIFNKHFERMVRYYKCLTAVLASGTDNYKVQEFIGGYYKSLLQCQSLRQLRFQFHLLNRSLFNSWAPFRKLSEFLSDSFLNMGTNTVPSSKSINKLTVFMKMVLIGTFKDIPPHFIKIFECMTEYILKESFDGILKLLSVKFYLLLGEQEGAQPFLRNIYPLLIKNINLISQFDETLTLLVEVLDTIEKGQFSKLLDDILNYLPVARKVALLGITKSHQKYCVSFEEYLKLRILESEDTEASEYARELIKGITSFTPQEKVEIDTTEFVSKHSKEASQKLCHLIKEVLCDPSTVSPLFDTVMATAETLFQQKFDQEGLEFFPLFLLANMDFIPVDKLESIFGLLVGHYTSDNEMEDLKRLSTEAGVNIINRNPTQAANILRILEKLLQQSSAPSVVIFLGVLAPQLKEAAQNTVSDKIMTIFETNNEAIHLAITKHVHELIGFFKSPKELVRELYTKITTVEGPNQIGYPHLMAGLLKGIGIREVNVYMDKIVQPTPPKNHTQKKGKLYLLYALFENFGKALEPRISEVIKLIVATMSDYNEAIREISKAIARKVMVKLSAFAVKTLLPQLLKSLEEQEHWRVKTTYIWMLGNMSHCAPRQLHAYLPQIIPILCKYLSDTHSDIRDTVTNALKVVGETIKNPEIFSSMDILVNALSDPFINSKKALQFLLKTKFFHSIDKPALSVIVPILNYCLKSRDGVLKQYACQVLGSLVMILESPDDLLQYLEFLSEGVKIALCDSVQSIRGFAARALGKISNTIGIQNTDKYFSFIGQILSSENATSFQRQGAANGMAQYICAHDTEFFQHSLKKIYQQLQEAKGSQKQGYISIFIHVPQIMKQNFQNYIKGLTTTVTIFVSDSDEAVRNASLEVEKQLIENFGISHTEMLLDPLIEGLFQDNQRKRRGALILIGQMISVLKSHLYENPADKEKEAAYYEALMGIYISKDDEAEMPRNTAKQLWNTYVENNTPKTIKEGVPHLVKMWSRSILFEMAKLVLNSISVFSGKYTQLHFKELLQAIEDQLVSRTCDEGAFAVLGELMRHLSAPFLSKFGQTLDHLFAKYLIQRCSTSARSLQTFLSYLQKTNKVEWVESKASELLQSCSDAMDLSSPDTKDLSSPDAMDLSSPEYMFALHLLSILSSSSNKDIQACIHNLLSQSPLTAIKCEVVLSKGGDSHEDVAERAREELKGQNRKGILTVLKQLSSKYPIIAEMAQREQ